MARSPCHALRVLALVVTLGAVGGCALIETPATTAVPSAPAPAPSASDLREGARLQRSAVALMSPRGTRPADPEGAARLVEQAAQLGDPDAQLMLAHGHLSGADGARDPAAALPWLQRAAQQGNAEAQYRLAQLLEAGDGTARDVAWAAVWFQRAAERGLPQAQFALAMLQVAGEGTARDEAEALARFTIAEQRGVAAAARYRAALQGRVPPAAARQALARIRSETARGPVPPVDRAVVRFAQSTLAARGSWTGPVDGRDSPAIRAALTAFAREQGLPAESPFAPAVVDRLRQVAGRR